MHEIPDDESSSLISQGQTQLSDKEPSVLFGCSDSSLVFCNHLRLLPREEGSGEIQSDKTVPTTMLEVHMQLLNSISKA